MQTTYPDLDEHLSLVKEKPSTQTLRLLADRIYQMGFEDGFSDSGG